MGSYDESQLLDDPSRKRSFGHSDDESGQGPAKRLARSADVAFRLVVPSSKIGKIIGKQGARVRQLREELGAHIKISDAASGAEDRVILISSKEEETIDARSAAEYALVRVASMAMEESYEGSVVAVIGQQNQGFNNLTRLLIGRSQAGSLIGKGGSVIKEIRDVSGATIRILPQAQMPLTSCASDTDRLVQVSGELFRVQKALEMIGLKLRENPSREPVTLKPSYLQQQILYAQAAYSGLHVQHHMNGNGTSSIAYGSLDSQPSGAETISAMPKVTAELSVPSSLIGGIIGRGGANITQIRAISGCAVKVFSQKDGATDRLITFEGTGEQVSAAQSLVQAFMNAQ